MGALHRRRAASRMRRTKGRAIRGARACGDLRISTATAPSRLLRRRVQIRPMPAARRQWGRGRASGRRGHLDRRARVQRAPGTADEVQTPPGSVGRGADATREYRPSARRGGLRLRGHRAGSEAICGGCESASREFREGASRITRGAKGCGANARARKLDAAPSVGSGPTHRL